MDDCFESEVGKTIDIKSEECEKSSKIYSGIFSKVWNSWCF